MNHERTLGVNGQIVYIPSITKYHQWWIYKGVNKGVLALVNKGARWVQKIIFIQLLINIKEWKAALDQMN